MRLFPIFALFSFVAAKSPIHQRQASSLGDVLTQITTNAQSLDTVVKSFTTASDVSSLQAAINKVSQSVTGINTTASTLSLTDAVQIQSQVETLQSALQSTVTDLIAKKSVLVSAGAAALVAASLQAQLASAQQLSAAIVAAVPAPIAPLAGQLADGVVAVLQGGVDAFMDVAGLSTVTTTAAAMTSGSAVRFSAVTSAGQVKASATATGVGNSFIGAAAVNEVAHGLVGGMAGVVGFVVLIL